MTGEYRNDTLPQMRRSSFDGEVDRSRRNDALFQLSFAVEGFRNPGGVAENNVLHARLLLSHFVAHVGAGPRILCGASFLFRTQVRQGHDDRVA